MTAIRCSSADRAMACAASTRPPLVPYNPDTPAARQGTAHHEACALVVSPPPDLAARLLAIADRHGVDEEGVGRAYRAAERIWSEVRQWFPRARTEVPLAGLVARGTSDLVSVGEPLPGGRPDHIAVLDWKTGFGRTEHPHQLMAYADAAREMYGMPPGIILGIEAWTRHGEAIVHRFSEHDLDEFREELQRRVFGEETTPGPHCAWCPHQLACPPRDAYLRSTAAAIATTEPREISPAALGSLYERAKMLRGALARYDEALRAAIAEVGEVPLPDGRVLRDIGSERTEIDPRRAWPVLERWFDDEQLAEAVAIGKGAITDLAKSQAQRGQKAARVAELMRDLDAAGAITIKRQSRIAPVAQEASDD